MSACYMVSVKVSKIDLGILSANNEAYVIFASAVRSIVHEYLSKSKSFGHLFYLSKSKSST